MSVPAHGPSTRRLLKVPESPSATSQCRAAGGDHFPTALMFSPRSRSPPRALILLMRSELRQAIRTLVKSPGFAVSAILILGLGCAASTSIFSVAYSVLVRDLPYPAPDRLVSVSTRLPHAVVSKAPAGAADYFDWRRRQQVFTDLALTRLVANFNLTGGDEPERIRGTRTTASLFHTLGIRPLIGRTFTEAEQLDPDRAVTVVVLSYSLWQRRFGGDPGILNRKIRLNGHDTEVIGVMPPEFHYLGRDYELWEPLYYPPEELRDRSDLSYACVARLRPGITLAQARAQMSAVAANLGREYPKTNRDLGVYVEPLVGDITESVRPAMWLLLAAVGMLFLVGCVNLANLLLARATGRQAEFAIRTALGAPVRGLCGKRSLKLFHSASPALHSAYLAPMPCSSCWFRYFRPDSRASKRSRYIRRSCCSLSRYPSSARSPFRSHPRCKFPPVSNAALRRTRVCAIS